MTVLLTYSHNIALSLVGISIYHVQWNIKCPLRRRCTDTCVFKGVLQSCDKAAIIGSISSNVTSRESSTSGGGRGVHRPFLLPHCLPPSARYHATHAFALTTAAAKRHPYAPPERYRRITGSRARNCRARPALCKCDQLSRYNRRGYSYRPRRNETCMSFVDDRPLSLSRPTMTTANRKTTDTINHHHGRYA